MDKTAKEALLAWSKTDEFKAWAKAYSDLTFLDAKYDFIKQLLKVDKMHNKVDITLHRLPDKDGIRVRIVRVINRRQHIMEISFDNIDTKLLTQEQVEKILNTVANNDNFIALKTTEG